MILKLKSQEPQVITKSHPKLGFLCLNTQSITQDQYQFYYDNGFKEYFEEVKPVKYTGIKNKKK
jgi:hypothetical protein